MNSLHYFKEVSLAFFFNSQGKILWIGLLIQHMGGLLPVLVLKCSSPVAGSASFRRALASHPRGVINLLCWEESRGYKERTSSKASPAGLWLPSCVHLITLVFVFRLFVCLMCLLPLPFFSSVPKGEFLSPSTGGKFLKPASQALHLPGLQDKGFHTGGSRNSFLYPPPPPSTFSQMLSVCLYDH